MTLGRRDEAIAYLESALRLNEEMDTPPWSAHTQVDLARALRARGGRADGTRAEQLERAALATAEALGMRSLQTRMVASGLDATRAPSAGTSVSRFRREGEYWTVAFNG